jgi:hypothetical protein
MSEVASSAKRGASLSPSVIWFMKQIFSLEIEKEITISLLEALPLPVYRDQGQFIKNFASASSNSKCYVREKYWDVKKRLSEMEMITTEKMYIKAQGRRRQVNGIVLDKKFIHKLELVTNGFIRLGGFGKVSEEEEKLFD